MIPEAIEKRERLNKYVDQAVHLMKELDTLKEDIKELKEMVKGEIGEDAAKAFPAICKARYDAAKLQEVIEKAQTALAEDEILRGNV